MALNPLTGTATSTVKVPDLNAVITALNAELDAVRAQIAAMDARGNYFAGRITDLENTPPVNIEGALSRIAALESEPAPAMPPDLTTRVEALEALIQRAPAENPAPQAVQVAAPGKPPGLNPNELSLVYNRAVLYYHDIEMYADRLSETKWRLYASLNFIVISPAVWTYDEIVEGTPEEVYEHARRRLTELAELKPQHDAVHERVVRMSEGQA